MINEEMGTAWLENDISGTKFPLLASLSRLSNSYTPLTTVGMIFIFGITGYASFTGLRRWRPYANLR